MTAPSVTPSQIRSALLLREEIALLDVRHAPSATPADMRRRLRDDCLSLLGRWRCVGSHANMTVSVQSLSRKK
jgi:hypothetical protein